MPEFVAAVARTREMPTIATVNRLWCSVFIVAMTACALLAPVQLATAAPTGTVYGSVIDLDGKPAAGSNVTVMAYPIVTDDAASPTDPAGPIAMYDLGSATVGDDGTYASDADLTTVPAEYKLPSGAVNVVVSVTTALGFQHFMTVASPLADANVSFDLAADQVTSTTDQSTENTGAVTARAVTFPASKAGTVQPMGCTPPMWQDKWVYAVPEQAVTAYPRPYGKVDVAQTAGSEQTLGVASQGSGGVFTASGSSSVTISSGSGDVKHGLRYPYRVMNLVNYRQQEVYCSNDGCGGTCSGTRLYDYAVYNIYNPNNGFRSTSAPSPSRFSYCVTKSDTTSTKSVGKNYTFDAGVDASSTALGISLSSHAAFSSSTELTWNFAPGHKVRLCGNGPVGWFSSQMAAAREYVPPPPPCRPPGPCDAQTGTRRVAR